MSTCGWVRGWVMHGVGLARTWAIALACGVLAIGPRPVIGLAASQDTPQDAPRDASQDTPQGAPRDTAPDDAQDGAGAGVTATFRVQGQPEGAALRAIVAGDVLIGTLAFDRPREGYTSVHYWRRRPGDDGDGRHLGNLFCRRLDERGTAFSVNSLAINHNASFASRVQVELGDVLVLKIVGAGDAEIGRVELPVVGNRAWDADPPRPERPSAIDVLERGREEIVAASEDPQTGRLAVARRLPDGQIVRSTGTVSRDDDGTVRISEVDDQGNRRETTAHPDGRVRTTVRRADLSAQDTLIRPDGTIVHAEKSGDGYVYVRELMEDGSTVTTEYGLDGQPTKTTSEHPSGWRSVETADGGVVSSVTTDDGVGVAIEVDPAGNARIIYIDELGEHLGYVRDRVGPSEPGRAYFETVLGESGWDQLPEQSKTFYADKAAEAAIKAEYDARLAAAEAADRAAEAQRQAEDARAREAVRARLDAIRAEQEAADRRAAQAAARLERQRQLDASWTKAKDLRRRYREAVATGDAEEAARIAGLQGEHARASAGLLEFTAEEAAEVERQARVRSDLASRVHGRAAAMAESEIAELDAYQSAKAKTTDKTKWVSIGSQMQQSTDRTTRMANHARAMAAAKVREIDRMLEGDQISGEQRDMLVQMRRAAIDQEASAEAHLRSNGRLTTLGYAADAALVLTGGKAFEGAHNLTKAAAAKVFTQQTAARVTSVVAERGVLELAGRGVTRATTAATSRAVSPQAAAAAERVLSTDLGAVSADAARRVLGEQASRAFAARAARAGEVLTTDVLELSGEMGRRLTARGERSAVAELGERTEIMTAEQIDRALLAAERDRLAYLAQLEKTPPVTVATRPSSMTPAQRQAFNDARAAEAIRNAPALQESMVLGSDVLAHAPMKPPRLTWSADDIVRIHRPGQALSRADVHLKAELYRQREVARRAGVDALRNGLDDELAYWQDRFQYFNRLIEDAKAAALR